MKITTKTSIILISTLILGIIIGILGSGQLHQKRFETIRKMGPSQRFAEVMDEIIQPDDQQRKAIEQILEKQTQKIDNLEEEYQSKILDIFQSSHQEIESLLSKEQFIQLESKLARGHDRLVMRRIEHMDEVLNLDDTQRQKIEKLVRHSTPGFPYQKPRYLGKRRRGPEKVGSPRDLVEKEIEAILNPEQLDKYRELRKEHGQPLSRPLRVPPK